MKNPGSARSDSDLLPCYVMIGSLLLFSCTFGGQASELGIRRNQFWCLHCSSCSSPPLTHRTQCSTRQPDTQLLLHATGKGPACSLLEVCFFISYILLIWKGPELGRDEGCHTLAACSGCPQHAAFELFTSCCSSHELSACHYSGTSSSPLQWLLKAPPSPYTTNIPLSLQQESHHLPL